MMLAWDGMHDVCNALSDMLHAAQLLCVSSHVHVAAGRAHAACSLAVCLLACLRDNFYRAQWSEV